jgi:hypothetical protein
MNVGIGTEAALFPEKEYIMEISFAVCCELVIIRQGWIHVQIKRMCSFKCEYGLLDLGNNAVHTVYRNMGQI